MRNRVLKFDGCQFKKRKKRANHQQAYKITTLFVWPCRCHTDGCKTNWIITNVWLSLRKGNSRRSKNVFTPWKRCLEFETVTSANLIVQLVWHQHRWYFFSNPTVLIDCARSGDGQRRVSPSQNNIFSVIKFPIDMTTILSSIRHPNRIYIFISFLHFFLHIFMSPNILTGLTIGS